MTRVVRGLRQRRYLTRAAASLGQSLAPAASGLISLVAIWIGGLETWGTFLGAMILVRLASQVASFGSRDRLLREFARRPSEVGAAWLGSVRARAWLLVPAPFVMLALGTPPERTLLLSTWLVALFLGQSYDALVVHRRDFAFAAAMELLSTGLIVFAIVVAGQRLGVDLLIAVFAAAAIVRAVALGRRLQPTRRPILPGGSDRATLRPRVSVGGELRASFPFFALTFAGAVQSRLDLYVVAALMPPAALGAYGVLSGFVALLQGSAAALLAPVIRPLYRVSRAGLLAITGRFTLLGLVVATAGTAGTGLVLTTLYRIEVPVLAIAAAWFAVVPCFIYAPLVYLWFRDGRTRVVITGSVAGIGVGLATSLFLVPTLGISGAMLSAALAQVAIAAFHIVGVAWSGLPLAARAGGDVGP